MPVHSDDPTVDTMTGPSGAHTSDGRLTKAEFRGQCRALFRRYIPASELGRLQGYQQAFIGLSEHCTPEIRYWIITQLKLQDGVGVLNPYTEAELRRVEALLKTSL
jgi:hypothetical protein